MARPGPARYFRQMAHPQVQGAAAVAAPQGIVREVLPSASPHVARALVHVPGPAHVVEPAPYHRISYNIGPAYATEASGDLKALGEDARGLAVSRATPYPWRATTPLARDFGRLMQQAGKTVDYDHFAGYINARVLLEGLKAAARDASPQAVTRGMQSLGALDLGGYVLHFAPGKHHGSDFVEITVVGPGGKFLR